MASPRKIFRIEETAATRRAPDPNGEAAARHAEIMEALCSLRSSVAGPPPASRREGRQADVERLAGVLNCVHAALAGTRDVLDSCGVSRLPAAQITRVADELTAVMTCSEQATQKILAAAEDIDQAANNLSAALHDQMTHGLAQDIQDRVIQIFEACNFQDLTSQRVAKVMAALHRIEDHIMRSLGELARSDDGPSAHGPRLESDSGHVAQDEIDAMFVVGGRS